MTKSPYEVEFKWSVRDVRDFEKFTMALAVLPLKVSRRLSYIVNDTYVDGVGNGFAKFGLKARIRKINAKTEVTFKGMSAGRFGWVKRLERNFKINTHSSEPNSLILKRLNQFAPEEIRLKQLFQIKNQRTKFIISGRKIKAEVCFDNVEIRKKDRNAYLREIELEFKSGSLKRFRNLVAQLSLMTRLKPSRISKVATAYKIFKLPVFKIKKLSPQARKGFFVSL